MSTRSRESVILFPFMAQGHLIPYLALALRIQSKFGYNVTIVNTPLNIHKLQQLLPLNKTSKINLVELPFSCSDHNLPPNSENTDVLPYPLIINLLKSLHSLKPHFHKFISDHLVTPLCIISDIFLGWTVEIAQEFGIFHSVFVTGGAYGMGVFYSIWLNQPQIHQKDSEEILVPDFPQNYKIQRSQLSNLQLRATGTDTWSLFNKTELSQTLNSDGFLINTIEDFDQVGLSYFKSKLGQNSVWAVGPVADYSLALKSKITTTSSDIIQWLEKHEKSSVLYISFGSQDTISRSQIMELAIGLEKSNKNFIWVIRPPLGFDINEEFRSEWKKKGLLVRKWAPQLEILSHKSTSVFLSYCGWNSVLESLSFGVPIIGWPLGADQLSNSRLLEEEMGVCVELAKGNRNEVKHEDVVNEKESLFKNAIREDEGLEGSSVKGIKEFLAAALLRKKEKKMDHHGTTCTPRHPKPDCSSFTV
ncbi:hypothetical protein MKW94_008316 [Papaver nudicaule]|uniref:Glycosyltransferase n=1 Tax=Papaver nudicaule TaxID=74823 RepID=A0AA41RYR5_PAPNU|nr:hypothetical protein [Papaver nudicaule]